MSYRYLCRIWASGIAVVGGMEGYRYLVGSVLWEVGSGIGEFLPCRGQVPPLLHVSHGCEHSPSHFGD